jgi:hypothetical protein
VTLDSASRSPRSLARLTQTLAAAAAVSLGGAAHADTIFATEDPGGFFGYIGFDLFPQQSVAARFIPATEHTLDRVGIWFMSNDFDGTTPQTVTVSLRTDVNPGGEFDSIPSEVILETWTRDVQVVGWTPALEFFDSTIHSTLHAGQKYWFVAESNVPALVNPIWVWAAFGNEFTATTDGPGTSWEGGFGAAVGIRVEGTPTVPPCRADFNGSGEATVQDIFDFLAAYFGNDPRADINSSGEISVQDIFDFLALYFAGC